MKKACTLVRWNYMPAILPPTPVRNLRLKIDASGEDAYSIHALASQPPRDAVGRLSAADVRPNLKQAKKLAAGQPVTPADLQALGRHNFAALFGEAVRDLLRDTQARLVEQQ